MSKRYILAGPADAGNLFGFWRPGLVPAGRWAIVERGELANGGHGPCTVDGTMYASEEAAEAALAQWEAGE
jgi:hypothetical protein